MRSLVLLLLLLLLLICCSLQEKEKKRKNASLNPAEDEDFNPRTFSLKRPPRTRKIRVNVTQILSHVTSNPTVLPLSSVATEYLNGRLSTQVIPVVYMLALLVGVPANVGILCLLAAKAGQASCDVLYCSLAVSDLLLLLSLFFKAHYHLLGNHWVLGELACRVVTACFYGNLYGSALTIACITAKRYMAVVHPFTYRSLPRQKWTFLAVICVWGVFAAAGIPELAVRQTFPLSQPNHTTCHDVLPLVQDSHAFLVYSNLTLTALCLLVPMGVTGACFLQIIRQLGRSHFDWARYTKASYLVFAIFVVSFLPAGALNFLHYVQLFADGPDGLYAAVNVAACLCCLHACLDPFLFLFMSKSLGSKLRFSNFQEQSLTV